MASDVISSKNLIDAIKSMRVVFGNEDVFPDHVKNSVILAINLQPAVDAIPIDTVAEMLADLFGDCCPCNYNDIDEVLSIGCERKNCPGVFEYDYSCWKKYVEWWWKVMKDGK